LKENLTTEWTIKHLEDTIINKNQTTQSCRKILEKDYEFAGGKLTHLTRRIRKR
jgi:hypothetical protein